MLTEIDLTPRVSNRISIRNIPDDIKLDDLDAAAWQKADEVLIDSSWSGDRAPLTRRFRSRLLWTEKDLYVRFDAEQHEPLVVSDTPDRSKKTLGLWDRDVVEIFIAPDRTRPDRYFEFEVAPTGEWVDLGIEITPEKRVTNTGYVSGMESAARIEKGRVVTAMKIPFESLDCRPNTGDVSLGNLFRCIGSGPTRGYLAWRPTRTKEPSFHVPSAFGEFHFVE